MTELAHIRRFDDVRATDRPSVGGKCASLGELISAGMAVPPGFAVTVEAFETACGDLRHRLAAAPSAEEAAALVRGTPVPPLIADAVRAAYAELCRREGRADLPVAVRSSAVAEDGAAASFAGQQETYLWTVGADDVVARVRDCWASLYTPQAVAYRARLPRERVLEATRIAVGVQAMVDAVVSGVAVTVSPRTGDRSVVAVNASWGLGQAVVSGEVTPDEFWLSKAGPTLTGGRIAHKTRECRPAPDGRGVVTVDVPPERRDVAALADEQVRALARIAVRVEEHYGCPQDIEWALDASGRMLILQSRPETTWRSVRAARPSAGNAFLDLVHAVGARVERR
jgi:pyruvate,water dikinase